VPDGDAELGGGERGGGGRVDVARDQHQVGRVLHQVGLDPDQDSRGLLGMGAGSDPEVGVGLGHAEVLDEAAGQRPVVVLAGVQQPYRDPVDSLKGLDDRGGLDEVRPRSDHREHGGSHSAGT
jgi:hypothetical protein